jgi:dolichyl-phosphate-mannose--protein O-mannosyl transferase
VEAGGSPAPGPSPVTTSPLRWKRVDTVILLSLLLLAGLVRFVRLDQPSQIIFDETYYARDACRYIGHTAKECGAPEPSTIEFRHNGRIERLDKLEQSYVHPPLGKWIIAIGIKLFGYNPFGWRFSAALFGTALVAVVFMMTRILFRRRLTATVAGLLVATDFLLIVQSRVALLDIFLAFFVALGFLFMAKDREHVLHLLEPGDPLGPEPRRRWLRVAAGLAFGASIAVKWSGILALAGAGLLALGWSASLGLRRVGLPDDGPRPPSLLNELVFTFVALVVVPVGVYMASYLVWLADHHWSLVHFVELHKRVFSFHETLRARHAYQSSAWSWPLVQRPVLYYYHGPPTYPQSSNVSAIGNVVTWYAALVAGVWMLIRSARKWRPERVVMMGWLAQYLPWLFVQRTLFFFYMTPVVPFMMIALAAGLTRMGDAGRLERWLAGSFVALGVGVMLWFFYPYLTAIPMPLELWKSHLWFPTWL